jgi:phage terminase large subunit
MSGLVSRASRLVKAANSERSQALPPGILSFLCIFDPNDPNPFNARRSRLQLGILGADRRFNSRVLHRRFGKTVMEVAKLVDRAVENPLADPRYAYFAPTYAQAEDIAWTYLTDFHGRLCEHLKVEPTDWQDKSKLACWFPTRNGGRARVRLYGLDSPKQRIRGLYLDGAVFDEWPWIPPSAWFQQVRPMLSDSGRARMDMQGRRNQWADFIFTPYGRDHAYDMHRKAEMWQKGLAVEDADADTGEVLSVKRDDWTATLLRASETKVIEDSELVAMRMDLGKSKYEQEMECSFDAAVEGSILGKAISEAREEGRIGEHWWNRMLPVHTAWDLGMDDATAIWFFQKVGDTCRVIDYLEGTGMTLDWYADQLAEKPYRYGRMFFPHDVEVRELGAGKRKEVLQQLGIRVTVVPKVSKADLVAAAVWLMPKCTFGEQRTAVGLDHLALWRRDYNEKLRTFSQNPKHDNHSHAGDAFCYMGLAFKSIRENGDERPANAQC